MPERRQKCKNITKGRRKKRFPCVSQWTGEVFHSLRAKRTVGLITREFSPGMKVKYDCEVPLVVVENASNPKSRGRKSFPASANGLVRSSTPCEPKEPWG
ncbi:hypothetical protein ACN38_g3368 [Penicillium nordicum]|uniref:Uncharacterized protein n=1 Tax=Penicillium nordicum TaxID=229535 RepID=A0A0M8P5M9_9EURO|nr:hypothetical protein ACN38_g3368 [Penicillium nordicum]